MKTSRKAQSVYRNHSALVRAVFERAGDARKVLCVALDYAKRKHLALICDAHGDVLKAAFPVENNAAGIAHLIQEITRCRRTLVRQQTAASNRIHALADQLFPGFLNGSKSALTPFCDVSCSFHVHRVIAHRAALRRGLRNHFKRLFATRFGTSHRPPPAKLSSSI